SGRRQDDPRDAVPAGGPGRRGALPVRRPRRAPERAEDQHAGIPLEPGRPRRPRRELRYPTVRAHADPRDLHGGRAREDASDRGAVPEDPGLREQGSHGPLVAATAEEPVPEEKLRARRDQHGPDGCYGPLRPLFRGSTSADVNAAFVRQMYDYF